MSEFVVNSVTEGGMNCLHLCEKENRHKDTKY